MRETCIISASAWCIYMHIAHTSPCMKQFFNAMVAPSLWWLTLNFMCWTETTACGDKQQLLRVFHMYSYGRLSTHGDVAVTITVKSDHLIVWVYRLEDKCQLQFEPESNSGDIITFRICHPELQFLCPKALAFRIINNFDCLLHAENKKIKSNNSAAILLRENPRYTCFFQLNGENQFEFDSAMLTVLHLRFSRSEHFRWPRQSKQIESKNIPMRWNSGKWFQTHFSRRQKKNEHQSVLFSG